MRLSKNEVTQILPYPLHSDPVAHGNPSSAIRPSSGFIQERISEAPAAQDVADLMDLVSDHRPELLKWLLDVLGESGATCDNADALTDLVAACGVAESASPCATAMAISADLDRLAAAADRWTHPAQIVERPDASALYRLCATRIETASGAARESLEKILPRLERTARLTEKAASRRVRAVPAGRARWSDGWL